MDAHEIGSEAEQQPIVVNNEHFGNDLSEEDTFVEHSRSHHHVPIKHQDEIELSQQSLHNNHPDNPDKDIQLMDNLNDVENKQHPTNIEPATKSIDSSIFGNAFTRCIYFAFSLFIFTILSFALWFFNVEQNLHAAFGLSAFGNVYIYISYIFRDNTM